MTAVVAAGSAELEAKLAAFVRDNRLPGGTAGVVHGAELAWSAGVGFADLGTSEPTLPGSLYRIASITKTFTGTAIMQLRDAVSPCAPIDAVTVRRVHSHESGLPAEARDPDVFVPQARTSLPGEKIRFRRLPDGRVASVFLMDSTFVRLDRADG